MGYWQNPYWALYRLPEWEYLYGARLLEILCVGVVFLTLVQSLTAMLQGVGRTGIPVRNLLIGGAAFKVVITFVLVGTPSWNIQGRPSVPWSLRGSSSSELYVRHKAYGIDFSFVDFIVKPAISVTVMGLIVHYSYGIMFSQTESNIISLGISILIGVVVYAVMLPITRAITQEDLEALPRGRSIARLLSRLGLLR